MKAVFKTMSISTPITNVAQVLLAKRLVAHQYQQVYVMPPNVVKSSRGRYGQTGAHTDQTDAYLLANLLRTDKQRLQPWHPDSPLTQQMRAKISLYRHLKQNINRLSNRLRAVLLRYYPAALTVFSTLDAPITLDFIGHYPTPALAARLSYEEFRAFARAHHYPKSAQLAGRFARLQTPQPEAAAATIASYQAEAMLLAELILTQVQAHKQTVKALKHLFGQHPDQGIYDSLPGVGPYLAPALLVKFGDDRHRFATAASVPALAGTCPVTEQSGQRRRIKFRRACDRSFRDIDQHGRCIPWTSLSGPMLITMTCGNEVTPKTTLCVVWATVGWPSSGNCGRPSSLMMKAIIYNNMPSAVGQRPPKRLLNYD